jgi:indolepyruvate ferredoxin oxidoreductase, beta subunit
MSSQKKDGFNILLVGVGGQGIILGSNLLAQLGLKLGLDVKKSEIHGMSQRGGSVESHVRLSPKVLSPLIPKGEADFVVAMEGSESLRHPDFPAKDATLIVSTLRVVPPSVTTGKEGYPSVDAIEGELRRHFDSVFMLDVPKILREVGNPRTANIVQLGCLSAFLPWPEEVWLETLKENLPPKILEVNLKAFGKGREAGLAARG